MKTFIACGKTYDLNWVNGKVLSSDTHVSTEVNALTSGLNNRTSITTTHVTHDKIFLVDRSGYEHSFQLTDFNIAARPTNEVTVVWAVQKGKEIGAVVAVHNFTTGNSFFKDVILYKIFRRPTWQLLVALFLGYFVGGIPLTLSRINADFSTAQLMGKEPANVNALLLWLPFLLPVAIFVFWYRSIKKGAKKFKSSINFNELR